MTAPTPDPTGRPPTAKQAAGEGPAVPVNGSTGSHRPSGSEPSLSDLFRGSSSSARRAPNPADVAAHLANPAPRTDDDAPTVITQAGKPPTAPRPPYVVGEGPSVAGRRLGHFELIEAVGAGGMAAVLKARDLELGRIVALKILPPESTHDLENVTRFKQEARAAAKLDHENVARVYFCGEDQGLHFIAFEFVEGVTLRALIDRRGPLPAGECVRYMIQIAAGLTHAAERGVVHRDIKPSNILITPDGRAKIVDMGLARHLESQSVNGGVTQSGVTLGTFDYISPEQALDPRRADVRSDIYSLGCTFYHALTGRPPVPEGTAAKKLYAHQHVDPLDPRVLNPAIPNELAAVLARMMAKNPDRRYQTPTALIAQLKAVAGHLRLVLDAVAGDSAVRAVPASNRLLPEGPRLRLSWVAAGAAIATAAVLIAVSATGPARTPPPPPWPIAAAQTRPDERDPAGPAVGVGHARPAADGDLVTTAEMLAKKLSDPTTKKVRLAPGKYDLTRLDKPVTFQGGPGSQIELTAAGGRPEIRIAPPPPGVPVTLPRPGTLTLKADGVAIRGVRFDVVPPPPPGPNEQTGLPDSTAADGSGLTVETAHLELTDCTFFPDHSLTQKGVSVVGVWPAGDAPVEVRLDRCLFAPGVGLRVPARVAVSVEDSGFGPYTAAVQLRADKSSEAFADGAQAAAPDAAQVRLSRSTFMLDANSAAVAVDPPVGPDVRVTAGDCVFAPAGGGATELKASGPILSSRPGAVVRAPGDKPTGVRLAGAKDRKNAYYGVNPLATAARGYSFEACKAQKLPADDKGWVKLDRRPWDAPGSVLAAFDQSEPWRAFRLRVFGDAKDPNLFLARGDPVRVLGAQFHDSRREEIPLAYSGPPADWPPDPVANLRQKVWVPKGADDTLKPGEYNNLVKLIQDARSGDTILIRDNGEVLIPPGHGVIEPPGPERGEFRLTFKADAGYVPVLAPEPRSAALDLSLFKVVEGSVRFEGLHFRLTPGGNQDSLAAVTLVAGKGCTFQDCTFTLAERDGQATAVVALADPGKVMRMDAVARAAPRIEFENCLIRGKGRGLMLPVSRPFDLRLEQCVTALYGPVVDAKAADRDPGSATPSAVKLSRVTALLGGPLVELHAGKVGLMRASGLVPTVVTADGCLFAAVPGAGRPIVEVSGTDLDRTDKNGVLRWVKGDHPNRFANFDPSSSAPALIRPGDDADKTWNWNEWIEFAREVGRPIGKVTFDRPIELRDLSGLRPADATVRAVDFPNLTGGAKPEDAGADPGKVAEPPDDLPKSE